MGRQHEIDFEQFVIGGLQAEAVVGLARAGVVRVHVEAQAADVRLLPREFVQVSEHRAEHAAAAAGFDHEDALDPPEISVAPIAPFVGDEQLAGARAIGFGDEINSLRGVAQQGVDAGGDAFGMQPPMLGLEREAQIAVREERGVGGGGMSDDDFDGSC